MRRSKYRNQPTVIDGIRFDSKREAKRYQELRYLSQIGEIKLLRRQIPYVLVPAVEMEGRYRRPITYKADFVYFDNKTNQEIVEDVKGVVTPVYNMKRHLMKSVHNIDILETR